MIDQLRAKENKELYTSIALVGILAILSYGRILFLHNVYEDDNCWLLSVYASKNLHEFLNTGWIELGRIPQGAFLYYFLKLHKTTDYAYLIWQSINLTLQVISPIVLFLFAYNLFRRNHLLAFFVACAFIIYPIDTTIPVLSNIFNRLGLLFAIISFYLTVKALTNNIRWTFLVFAIVLSGISYLLMEGTVALEPARFAIIAYIFYKKGIKSSPLIKKSLAIWSPFLILCIPLIIYKLTFKNYGMYEGYVLPDYLFVFDWESHKQLLKMLFFHNWYVFLRNYISHMTPLSILLSLYAMVFVFYFFKKIDNTDSELSFNQYNFPQSFKKIVTPFYIVFFLGAIFLIPPILMYEFVGRIPIFGVNSRHGVILQIGYAFFLGSGLYLFFKTVYYIFPKLRMLCFLIVIFIGFGVFFNNINLDLYFDSWQKQKQFWQSFTKRFPSLPEQSTFFIDAKSNNQPYSYNLDTSYDFELPLNLLYARSVDAEEFRKHRVLAPDEWKTIEKHMDKPDVPFDRLTHWGKDVIKANELIIIKYRDNDFLVNRQISPMVTAVSYPLRYKLKGFY